MPATSDTKAVEQYMEEIRNRLADITPGPWEVETGGPCVWHLGSGDTICTVNFDHQTGEHQPGEDQEFIASAPSDVAYLLDQLASIPSQIKAAKDEALREFVERQPDLSPTGIALVDLAYDLVNASRVDASGWMAGTPGAALAHERAKQKFNDAVAHARLADLADSLLMARSVHYTREHYRAAIRARGEVK